MFTHKLAAYRPVHLAGLGQTSISTTIDTLAQDTAAAIQATTNPGATPVTWVPGVGAVPTPAAAGTVGIGVLAIVALAAFLWLGRRS